MDAKSDYSQTLEPHSCIEELTLTQRDHIDRLATCNYVAVTVVDTNRFRFAVFAGHKHGEQIGPLMVHLNLLPAISFKLRAHGANVNVIRHRDERAKHKDAHAAVP